MRKFMGSLLAVVGAFTIIGAFTAQKSVGYTIGAILLGAACIALAILLFVSAKKSADKAEARILRTQIIDATSKTSTTSAVTRGAVGSFVAGPVGAVVGASTAKSNRETTFMIFYRNGDKKVKTVQNNSPEYQMLCKHLEQ